MTSHPADHSELKRIFNPRSIAVVGASPSAEKAGHQLLRALSNFQGALYPIHPKEKEILGFPAYPSVGEIEGPLDLAVMAIPAAKCAEALHEAKAVKRDLFGAMIIGGGFAESGEPGRTLQAQLNEVVQKSGLRLLGPNTVGFFNPSLNCAACFAPGLNDLKAGNLSIVSQSGGANVALSHMARNAGLGVRLAVGLGNAIDIDVADVLAFLADDKETHAVILALEGINNGRALFDIIADITPHKPVIALTVGKAKVDEFARSHTGKLIGQYELKVAALEQAGAVVVRSTTELIDAASVLLHQRLMPKSNPGVGIITGQAGPGLLILDDLRSSGVNVPVFSAATREKLGDLLPPLTYMDNPVDTARPSSSFTDVVDTVCRDENVDAVLMYALHEPATVDPATLFAELPLIGQLPIVFGSNGPDQTIRESRDLLAGRGVTLIPGPERAASAMRALIRDAANRPTHVLEASDETSDSFYLGGGSKNEADVKAVFQGLGFPVPLGKAYDNPIVASHALDEMSPPVAAKILDNDIRHKTEIGGVKLGIENATELETAIKELARIKKDACFLIEQMVPPGIDLILGAKNDPSFGPIILIGFGGTEAELWEDSAVRLAPISRRDAEGMIQSLRCSAMLDGWRGQPPADRAALVDAMRLMSTLICANPQISEIEINPLRVLTTGVVALDALLIQADPGGQTSPAS